ncbi:MAG: MTH1187 family thiamine-binding protein [bacterium]
MAIMEISVVPLGSGESVSRYVAECVKIAQQSDLTCTLTPMGTVVEGDIDKLLELAKKMHKSPFSQGAKRVLTTIKIDERTDKAVTAKDKIDSVTSKL